MARVLPSKLIRDALLRSRSHEHWQCHQRRGCAGICIFTRWVRSNWYSITLVIECNYWGTQHADVLVVFDTISSCGQGHPSFQLPVEELFGFERVGSLRPGHSTTIKLPVPPQALAFVDTAGTEAIRAGECVSWHIVQPTHFLFNLWHVIQALCSPCRFSIRIGGDPDGFVHATLGVVGDTYETFTFPRWDTQRAVPVRVEKSGCCGLLWRQTLRDHLFPRTSRPSTRVWCTYTQAHSRTRTLYVIPVLWHSRCTRVPVLVLVHKRGMHVLYYCNIAKPID